MKSISCVLVTALAFAAAGCAKKTADCAKAIANGMDLSKADMEKAPGMDAAKMDKLRDLGVQQCKDDKWSDDILKCMVEAKTKTDAQGCYGKLPPEQQAKMNKAAMDVMTPPGAGGGPGSAAGGSAMGSDTGSAAAGSATTGSAGTGGSAAGSAAAPQ